MRAVGVVLCWLLLLDQLAGWVSSSIIGSQPKIAMIVIDVQNCFMTGGDLGAIHADMIVPVINQVRAQYGSHITKVIMVQDWHCTNDVAFVSQYPGRRKFESVTLHYNKKGRLCRSANMSLPYARRCRTIEYTVEQTLWPTHCVADSIGADFASDLILEPTDIILRKGELCHVDTYSAFEYKGGFHVTGLDKILTDEGISVVLIMGLVLEYSIAYSCIDAAERNYSTYLIIDATGNANVWQTKPVLHELGKRGVRVIRAQDLKLILQKMGHISGSCRPTVHRQLTLLCLLAALACCIINTTHHHQLLTRWLDRATCTIMPTRAR